MNRLAVWMLCAICVVGVTSCRDKSPDPAAGKPTEKTPTEARNIDPPHAEGVGNISDVSNSSETQQNETSPPPLPLALVEKWEQAGARFTPQDRAEFSFQEIGFGPLPSFRFSKWPKEGIGQLPQPQQPFVLNLTFSGVTDERCQEIAALDSLQIMILRGSKVTDNGLKELAKLENLAD